MAVEVGTLFARALKPKQPTCAGSSEVARCAGRSWAQDSRRHCESDGEEQGHAIQRERVWQHENGGDPENETDRPEPQGRQATILRRGVGLSIFR